MVIVNFIRDKEVGIFARVQRLCKEEREAAAKYAKDKVSKKSEQSDD